MIRKKLILSVVLLMVIVLPFLFGISSCSNMKVAAQTVTTTNNSARKTYYITSSSKGGGTINPNGIQTVKAGSDITFSITPSKGYYLDTLTINNVMVDNIITMSSYTFLNVSGDSTIFAQFTKIPESTSAT
jgi:hypothetical protein